MRNKNLLPLITALLLLFSAGYSQSDYSLNFSNSNGYVSVPHSSDLDLTYQGTLETWLYIDELPSSGQQYAGLIHKGEDPDNIDLSYALNIYSNGSFGLLIKDQSGVEREYKSKTTFSDGYSGFISVSWDGTYVRLYINGIQDTFYSSNYSLSSSTGDLILGAAKVKNVSPLYCNYSFNGFLDEIRVWNVALTQNQVQDRQFDEIEYSSELGHLNSGGENLWNYLVGYWRFESGTTTNVLDGSQYLNSGSFNKGPDNSAMPEWNEPGFPMAVWTGDASDYWNNAANWSCGFVPDTTYNVTITAVSPKVEVDDDLACYHLVILPGASLTINTGQQLDVNGDLIIKTGDTITGSLIDLGTINISGTSTVERYIEKNGWHYISSPISDASTSVLTGSALYSYNEPYDSWDAHGSGESMLPMKGYDVYYSSINRIVEFTGTLNKDNYTTTVANLSSGWNLMGNPYPSTIDWDATSGWTKTYVENSIYFWDPQQGTYVAYVNGSGINGGSRHIPATQAFWIKCTSKYGFGTLGMTPEVRVHDNYTKFRSEPSKNELKIKVSGIDYADETVIRFREGATYEFDGNFDAVKIMSDNIQVPQIFTKDPKGDIIAINTLPEINNHESLPVILRIGKNGEYSLRFSMNDFPEGVNVLLEDTYLNTMHDVNTGAYHFEAVSGECEDRFILHFTNQQGIVNQYNEIEKDDQVEDLSVFSYNKSVYVKNPDPSEDYHVAIFNTLGEEIYSSNSYQQKIQLHHTTGYYIVKINQGGNHYATKVCIN